MKILILGANGQAGRELARVLASVGTVAAWDRASADLEDLPGLAGKVRAAAADVIVNAAAYTAVDRAESEPDRAFRVNAEAVGILAGCARESGAWLVHYSTDYVFDGTSDRPYAETDAAHPLNVYGRSKLAGEESVRASGCRHLIFRTSWVFAPRGQNFVSTILRLAADKELLRIVRDQIGAPTSARLIGEVTRRALESIDQTPCPEGTYHVAARGEASWHEYACFIVEEARRLGYKMRVGPDRIMPVPTSDYPQPAARPANSRLNTGKLESWLGIALPAWQTEVARAIGEIVSERPNHDA
jgi:dTDP-4-dehydrorhamnose reductase